MIYGCILAFDGDRPADYAAYVTRTQAWAKQTLQKVGGDASGPMAPFCKAAIIGCDDALERLARDHGRFDAAGKLLGYTD